MVTTLKSKDDLKELYHNWKTIFAAQDGGYVNYFFNEVYDNYQFYLVKDRDQIVSSLAQKTLVLSIDQVRLNTFYTRNYFTIYKYQDSLSKYQLFDNISELADHQALISLTNDDDPLYPSYNYEVIDRKITYRILSDNLVPVEEEHVTDVFNPIDLYKVRRQFYEKFACFIDDSIDEFYAYLNKIKKLNKKILVSKEGYEITGYIVYSLEPNLLIEEIVYFSGKTFFSLLNNVSEGYNKLYLIASENEQLQKLIANLEIVAEEKIYMRINNIKLFNKLFNTEFADSRAFVKEYRYKTNLFFIE